MPALIQTNPGERFGRLVLLKEAESVRGKRAFQCACDCGAVVVRCLKELRKGTTRSCGCLRREYVAAKNRRHGQAGRTGRRREYHLWKQMRQRCNNPHCEKWPDYGGRGIRIDPRWDDFAAFMADLGACPSPKHTVERIDVNGHYTPLNVRWATASEQARNKRNTIRVEYEGRVVALADLADEYGMRYGRLYTRLQKGWPLARALTEPVRPCRRA